MRICVLSSCSSGNCTLIESGESRILLDAGLPWSRTSARLQSIGVDPLSIDAVVISHEHSDHVAGVGPVARKLRCPVYVNAKTLACAATRFQKIDGNQIKLIESGKPFDIEDLQITPFPVPHDAANPFGFVIKANGTKVGIATDLGYATKVVKHALAGCDALVLETNHDRRMLLDGPYPWSLKQRIASRHGHLSNEQSADLLSELIHDDLAAVFLCHLSEENNTKELALEAAIEVLDEAERRDITLEMTYRECPSAVVAID
ncbi:MBL fold metallo-hydrolase [bacterium]|nr:MBL fold metallo-hydrolase [bacterium]